MQFKSQVTIVGAKPVDFKDEKTGRHYDYTTLYVEMPLDHSQGKNWGNAIEVFKWQDHKNIEKLQLHKAPLKCEMLIEAISNGKETNLVCLEVILPTVNPMNTAPKL